MFSFRKHYFQCAALFLFVVLSGCGSGGPKIVPVAGTLTHKGKPVANAIVHFTPEHGRPSSGLTDEEGHFTLQYDTAHDGTQVGKSIVSIKARPSTRKEQDAVMMGKQIPTSKEMASFFDRYGPGNSKYEVTIDRSTSDLKLELD